MVWIGSVREREVTECEVVWSFPFRMTEQMQMLMLICIVSDVEVVGNKNL